MFQVRRQMMTRTISLHGGLSSSGNLRHFQRKQRQHGKYLARTCNENRKAQQPFAPQAMTHQNYAITRVQQRQCDHCKRLITAGRYHYLQSR